MTNLKLTKIGLDEIHENLDSKAITGFFASKTVTRLPSLYFEHPFTLEAFAFIICIKGKARVTINFKEYVIEAGTIITILPFFIVEFLEKGEDLDLEYLVFSIDFIANTNIVNRGTFDVSQRIMESPCLNVGENEKATLLDFHAFIVKQYNKEDHPLREAIARSLMQALFIEIAGIYLSKEQPLMHTMQHEDLVNRFFLLLLQNHKQERSVSFYADKMCLTPKYLSSLMKKITGKTVHTWINESVVATAKFLLKTSEKNITEIADELNFPNSSFFGRLFKTMTGQTPQQYRNN